MFDVESKAKQQKVRPRIPNLLDYWYTTIRIEIQSLYIHFNKEIAKANDWMYVLNKANY